MAFRSPSCRSRREAPSPCHGSSAAICGSPPASRKTSGSSSTRVLTPPALSDRDLPSTAESLRRYADCRRGLAAFEFIRVDKAKDFEDEPTIESRGRDLIDFLPLLDVQLEDRVQCLVWRQ